VSSDSRISKIQELVHEMRVGEVMKKDVLTVGPRTHMSVLRIILQDKRISGTPVIDKGKLVGIISVEDFIKWLADREQDCPIGDKMTRDVQTLYTDEPLIHVVNKFERHGFGRFAVIDRESRQLRGIITKGDIVEGLLKKLEIDYDEEETRQQRIRRFFEDILADKIALFFQYVAPQIVRRVAIATYEAEMNLIIYADGGKIRVRVEPHQILVRVEDSGPGIPDIEKALQPGYSTAPEWIREMGFGAGMGLGNIRKCATRMVLTSEVGKGTHLRIYIGIEDEAENENS